jgi:double-stranded uracil-DNA glycosylase
VNQVTPDEIARRLGVSGPQFRSWLRDKWRGGDPRFTHHRAKDRWSFGPMTAVQLEIEYRDEHSGGREYAAAVDHLMTPHPQTPTAVQADDPVLSPTSSGHRITVEVNGEPIDTLADLLGPGLLAVVVGINPAPPSVKAGHYWQGRTGLTLWRRLRAVGLLPPQHDGFEDDAALKAGVGFTDVVKRPTRRADEVKESELAAGRAELERKLVELEVPLVIFAFKKAATTLLGDFVGNGFIEGRALGPSRVFVMPGPYEATVPAERTLAALRAWVRETRAP